MKARRRPRDIASRVQMLVTRKSRRMNMAKRLIVRFLVVGFMVTGGWAVGPVLATDQDKDKDKEQGDHKDRDHGDRDRSDFALFDGTNPANEAPPDGGAEGYVKSGF